MDIIFISNSLAAGVSHKYNEFRTHPLFGALKMMIGCVSGTEILVIGVRLMLDAIGDLLFCSGFFNAQLVKHAYDNGSYDS